MAGNVGGGQALLIMSSILRLGKSDLPTTAIDADSFERIASCLRVLLDPTPVTQSVFLEQCHVTYATLLASQTVRGEDNRGRYAVTLTRLHGA